MVSCRPNSFVMCDQPSDLPSAILQAVLRGCEPAAKVPRRAQVSHAMPLPQAKRKVAGNFPCMASRSADLRSDETLLQLHLGGDDRAFGVLVERYRNELHGFLARFLGSATAADDVFQDTFLQVHLSGATFDPTRTFKPWLFTIAANKARDFHRKRKRRAMTSLDAPIGSPDDGANLLDMLPSHESAPDSRSELVDQQALVKRVVDGLPEHHREVILLGYFQRMSYKQVADILEVPLGTVKSRLHAAVALFSDHWERMNKNNKGATKQS